MTPYKATTIASKVPGDEGKHTPGDWAVHSEDLRGGKYWCVFIPGKTADGEWYDTIDLHEDENGEANARLIAAAPDLLDACQVAIGHMTGGMDGDWRDCDPIEVLRAAIAKAKGA